MAPPIVDQRAALSEAFLEQMVRLRRRFAATMPEELREQMQAVTPHQIDALCLLQLREGMTMHELAKSQQCAFSTATALADRLIAHGLVERVDDPDDRRIVRLVPTASARAIIEAARSSKQRMGIELLSVLSDEEASTLVSLLRRITEKQEDEE